MGALEGGIIALVIVFYILRAVFQGVRGLIQTVRRLTAPRPMEQKIEPQQSNEKPIRQSRLEAQTRRPEAGGPAVTGTTTRQTPLVQIRRVEARTADPNPLSDLSVPSPVVSVTPELLKGPEDLLRAVILQEVLAKPLSQRRRRPPSALDTPSSPQ